MVIDIKDCDINNDYFHFTNKKNVNSILNNGLKPSIGASSQLVNDRPNVSISKGGKGIMGIINSFIYKYTNEINMSQIPEEQRKYFKEINNFESNSKISEEIAYKAMKRKLQDEVYFRVKPSESQLEEARIGGLTGYDINLPTEIGQDQLDIITDSNNKVMSALDVVQYIYERAKNIEAVRKMHPEFFKMFETREMPENDDLER
jgi:hypothetical protein